MYHFQKLWGKICRTAFWSTCTSRHWWTVTASLKRTRSGTSSQCCWSCSIWPRPRSNFWVPVITRAAAFNTCCNLSVMDWSEHRSRTRIIWILKIFKTHDFYWILKIPTKFYFEIRYFNFDWNITITLLCSHRNTQQWQVKDSNQWYPRRYSFRGGRCRWWQM